MAHLYRPIKAGSTDVSVEIKILDSTTGLPKTDVVYNSAGMDLQYRRAGGANVSITEATLGAVDSAHSDGGFIHIGNGEYRLDLPDAAVATGVDSVLVHGTVTGGVIQGIVIPLVTVSFSATVSSIPELGITALGTAQTVTGTSIQLASSEAFANDEIIGSTVIITDASTGRGQSRIITDYVASTDTATVDTWTTTPTGTIKYVVMGTPPSSASSPPNVNVVQISGDSVAADNLESYCDGTTPMPVDSIQISGDATAANNLESLLDGTGGITLNASAFTLSNPISANAIQISGDSIAADNLEAVLDGTGGVTLVASAITLTTPITANVTQISGDSVAADNLEAYTDGTTPMPVNVTHFGGTAGSFASGRPAVNTSHISGNAVSTSTAQIGVNVIQVSGDSTAADNLEAILDGTGGVAITASALTLTTPVTANVTQISGDSTAADNLESYCDGTDRIGVDVREVNSVALQGNGTSGNEWRPV